MAVSSATAPPSGTTIPWMTAARMVKMELRARELTIGGTTLLLPRPMETGTLARLFSDVPNRDASVGYDLTIANDVTVTQWRAVLAAATAAGLGAAHVDVAGTKLALTGTSPSSTAISRSTLLAVFRGGGLELWRPGSHESTSRDDYLLSPAPPQLISRIPAELDAAVADIVKNACRADACTSVRLYWGDGQGLLRIQQQLALLVGSAVWERPSFVVVDRDPGPVDLDLGASRCSHVEVRGGRTVSSTSGPCASALAGVRLGQPRVRGSADLVPLQTAMRASLPRLAACRSVVMGTNRSGADPLRALDAAPQFKAEVRLVLLRFDLTPSGAADKLTTHLGTAPLPAEAAACLTDALQRLSGPPASVTSHVEYPVEFR
jgi:hypothetical protein